MLNYAITFFIIAIVAAFLGFTGIAGSAASIAQILFFCVSSACCDFVSHRPARHHANSYTNNDVPLDYCNRSQVLSSQ